MKPDAWLPFYGNDFFGAVEGYDNNVIVGYMRALWHYWHHHHCDGLPDDDQYLQRICRCEAAFWMRTKGVIFNGTDFFTKIDGKWHQKRARQEYADAIEGFEKRQKQTAGARAARAIKPEPPPLRHGIIPTLEQCLNWLTEAKSNGADYSDSETRSAFLALQANGWMWGKNPVTDFRAAIERQIQTDRDRKRGSAASRPHKSFAP